MVVYRLWRDRYKNASLFIKELIFNSNMSDHIHNAVNVISLSLSPTLIVVIIIIVITITIIIIISPLQSLQVSLELWKAGQSPTEIDRSKTKDIIFHRPKPL